MRNILAGLFGILIAIGLWAVGITLKNPILFVGLALILNILAQFVIAGFLPEEDKE